MTQPAASGSASSGVAADGDLELEVAAPGHVAGQYTREGVRVRFDSAEGKDRATFELRDAKNELLLKTSSDGATFEVEILGGRLQMTGQNKGAGGAGPQPAPVTKGDEKALHELLERAEYKVLPYLSRALGARGAGGKTHPASLPIHFAGMTSARIHKISLGTGKKAPPPGEDSKKRAPGEAGAVACHDQTGDPCHDDCFGMCGAMCDCWEWACGDCCINNGCVAHDTWCSEFECNGGVAAGLECHGGPTVVVGTGLAGVATATYVGCNWQDQACVDGRVCTGDKGIGGYDLESPHDRSFAFDHEHTGRLDHMALYRPGSRTIWIEKNKNGVFSPVFQSKSGIGGYDLGSTADLAYAFDYEHSGRLDYMVLYRPGKGAIFIEKNVNGTFTPVYQQGDPGQGIGGYDLLSPADRSFAFDYEHSGKLDYMVLYRPARGAIFIEKNVNGTFTPVYQQGDPGQGIGGYDLKSPADQAFAFDYEKTGKLDHLVLYRPGSGIIWIEKNVNGVFSPVFQSKSGIGGYDLLSPADQAFAFDHEKTGKLDHLVLYRPGRGAIFILKNVNGTFTPVYQQGDPGRGIGGYNLGNAADQMYAFDYNHTGKLDYLVPYRPGYGLIWILLNRDGKLGPVYQSSYRH